MIQASGTRFEAVEALTACPIDVVLSVKDDIDRFRVAVGPRLLAETTEKVETISGHIGFADRSNFSRAFKHIDGVAPATRAPGNYR